jgi:hypothetical protein
VFRADAKEGVDGRVKPGHDEVVCRSITLPDALTAAVSLSWSALIEATSALSGI